MFFIFSFSISIAAPDCSGPAGSSEVCMFMWCSSMSRVYMELQGQMTTGFSGRPAPSGGQPVRPMSETTEYQGGNGLHRLRLCMLILSYWKKGIRPDNGTRQRGLPDDMAVPPPQTQEKTPGLKSRKNDGHIIVRYHGNFRFLRHSRIFSPNIMIFYPPPQLFLYYLLIFLHLNRNDLGKRTHGLSNGTDEAEENGR